MAANDRVGNVYLDVLPRGEGFNKNVQSIIDKAERDAKFAINANTGQAKKAVDDLGNQIKEKVGGSWIEAAGQAAAFTGAVYAVRAAVDGIVNKFAELFDGIAKARAGFNAILGEKTGETLLSQVRQFAIDSPFVTGELVNYSQQLLGVGKTANTIVPILKNVGDIVASVGGDTSQLGSILYALTQIQTIGKLTGQDARQLQNQLVPITKYIAEYTHKSVADVKKLQEAGGIASDVVFAAIENQGKKVEGALNNSVRTISGAKSVLSDTLRNFVQSNPGFAKIYDDLVQGIQKFAAEIGKPEIQAQINKFLDSIGHIYEALKPVIQGLGQFASSGGLTVLSTFTTTLEALATIINQFPAPVLRIIGTSLAAIAAIRAPFALIQYAQNIARISQGILGGGLLGGLTKTNTAFTQNAVVATGAGVAARQAASSYAVLTEQMTLLGRAQAKATAGLDKVKSSVSGKGALLGTLGAGVLGGIISSNSDDTNVAAQTAGSALTYGAVGASAGGPVGAAVGLAFGALTGYLSATEKRLEAQVQRNKALGEAAAEAYLRSNEVLFRSGTGEAYQKATDDLKDLEALRNKLAHQKFDDDGNLGTDILSFGQYGESGDDKKKKALASIDEQIKIQKDAAEQLTQPILDAVEALRKADQAGPFLKNLISPSSVGSNPVKDLVGLDEAFRKYGLTLTEVASKGPQAVLELITSINALDTVQKRATVTANVYADALKDATGKSKAIYDTEISNNTAQIGTINALTAAKSAAIAVDKGNQTEAEHQVAVITANNALLEAQQKARAQAEADVTVATADAIRVSKERNPQITAELEATRASTIATASDNAAKNVAIAVAKAHTIALGEQAVALKRANDELERSRALEDTSAAQGALTALQTARQAAGAAALNPSQATRLTAQNALLAAQNQAAQIAATNATREAQDKLNKALAEGTILVGSDKAKREQFLIDAARGYATETAYAKILNDVTLAGIEIERQAAEVRARGNADALQYLTNLTRGKELANQIFGSDIGKAQAQVDQIAAVTNANSALNDVLIDGATAAEAASFNVAALTAQASQYAAVFATGAGAAEANAIALDYYNIVLEASKISIANVTDKVVGLDGVLDRVDGRKAIAEVAVTGIQAALAQIAQLELALADLVSKNGGDGGIEGRIGTSSFGDFQQAAAANKAYRDELQHVVDIYNGTVEDDRGIFSGIGVKAHAAIQDTLDAEAAKAAKAAGKVDDAAEKYAEALRNATNSLADKLQSAADAISTAADKWIGSIRERTQYEQGISVARLTKNATQQGTDLAELTSGIANLRARGLTDEVLKKLGIDNIADLKQVRKLERASTSELLGLNAAVSSTGAQAVALATAEEQKAQRANITQAILDAAKTLGIDNKLSSSQAAQIAAQFNITPGLKPEEVAAEILSLLTSGALSR